MSLPQSSHCPLDKTGPGEAQREKGIVQNEEEMTGLKSDYRLPSVTKPVKPAGLVCFLKAKPDSSLPLSRSVL